MDKCKKTIKKIALGQYFTKGVQWLKPQINDFIKNSKCTVAYDPFAGAGDLLSVSPEYGIFETKGLDIDEKLDWENNDSLKSIPTIKDAIIITNPPYLAKQSASRKNICLNEYFKDSPYDDIYLVALSKMIEAQKHIVAIIPESFINSSFKDKNLLSSVTILEENPFNDTEVPVCVACFDGIYKDFSEIKIYKNDKFVDFLENIINLRIEPENSLKVTFNDTEGWLGIRAIDSTDDINNIKFDYKENIKYDWRNKIKNTSRHFTLVSIDISDDSRPKFLEKCNLLLNEIRIKSSDILLTPFMGNTKSGKRRRRLDFRLARAIIEKANNLMSREAV